MAAQSSTGTAVTGSMQCEPANGGDDDGGGGGKTGETAEKMDDEGGNDHIVAMMA
jgi:hypothetical protein